MASRTEYSGPRWAVHVGVTGHRELSHESEAALRERIREVLRLIEQGAQTVVASRPAIGAGGAPVFRAISPLAEGADRLFAWAAIDRGWELTCALPFGRDESRKDSHGREAAAEFDALLAHPRTTAIIELDGMREQQAVAYEAVGRLVLDRCDVLVAIWDGAGSQGRGGTAQIVGEATQRGLATLWIQTDPPHPARLIACLDGKPGCIVEPKQMTERLARTMADVLVRRAGGEKPGAHRER